MKAAQRLLMSDAIFREYDIRGVVDSELLVSEVYDLGKAMAFYALQQDPALKTVAIGMDGRTHSPAIKDELCRAFIDSGIDVVFVGMCTSPVLYFALHTLPVDAGCMITASHNPKEYNGIKFCVGARVVWGAELQVVRNFYHERSHIKTNRRGVYKEKNLIDAYVEYLALQFAHLQGMDFAAVVDCGNGAGGTVMPQLVKRMSWPRVQLLYEQVDGTYPNHEADPVVPENMAEVRRLLATTDVQLGMGLDGDCDRMAPMTKQGFLVPGDQLLALFAKQVLKMHSGAPIVFDLKSSAGLIEEIENNGGVARMSPSGHAIIKDQMKKYGALLGGELSCHFFFADRYFGYDDGVYALLRLFELIESSGTTLDELVQTFPKKYSSLEYRVSCADDAKQKIVESVKKWFASRADVRLITIDGVRAQMPYGWGLVRASNTQAKISMRFEADTSADLVQVKEDFIAALCTHLDESLLRKTFGLEL